VLRECWEAGVVLAGESAGSLCWHVAGVTDSFGPEVRPAPGLGWLPYCNAVHFGTRRAAFRALVADETSPGLGIATDTGAGLVYRRTGPAEVISDRARATGYRVERLPDGTVRETPLDARRRP
jgi:hypothetical protein